MSLRVNYVVAIAEASFVSRSFGATTVLDTISPSLHYVKITRTDNHAVEELVLTFMQRKRSTQGYCSRKLRYRWMEIIGETKIKIMLAPYF